MRLYSVLFILTTWVWAQSPTDSAVDLSELRIDKRKAFGKGLEVWKSDAVKSYQGITNNLGEEIASTSAIPFRHYGQGLLQSISTRGLTPQHTYVEWEGIPINSALNGQQDFSLLNYPLETQARLSTGSSATLLGSGAVGGALLLNQTSSSKTPLEANLRFGSFGFRQGGLRLNQNWGKWNVQLGTRILDSDNTYTFTNLSGEQIEQSNSDLQIQNYALKTTVQHSENQSTQLDVWHIHGARGLPANRVVTVNHQFQEDNQTRAVLAHSIISAKSRHEARIGFTHEETRFFLDRIQSDAGLYNQAQSLIAKYDWRFVPKKNWQFNVGFQANHSQAQGDNLSSENLNEAYLSLAAKYHLLPRVTLLSSLRKGVSNRFSIPFTYDLGVLLTAGKSHRVHVGFATSYRNPTLNDLFWQGLGNPELDSESGFMGDLNYTFLSKNQTEIQLGIFHGEFRDWIVWLPALDGVFRPENIQEVHTQGVEFSLDKKWRIGTHLLGTNLGYQYTRTRDQVRDAQLIYTPLHSGNANAFWQRNNYRLYINNQIQGKSYATRDESVETNGFVATTLGAQYAVDFGKVNLTWGAEIRNVWNTQIETIRNFVAPGRSYMLELNIKLK